MEQLGFASSGLCHPMLPLHTTPRMNSSSSATACNSHFSACLKCTLFSASSWPHHIMHALPVPGSQPQRLTACPSCTKGMPALFVYAVYICAFVCPVGPLFHLCFCGRSAVQGTRPAVCGSHTRQCSCTCAGVASVLCAEIVSVFCAETVSVFGGMLLHADVQSARFS